MSGKVSRFSTGSRLRPEKNKFHQGAPDGKHYWLTPKDLYERFYAEFDFTFDPAPHPKPDEFDGLTCEWGGFELRQSSVWIHHAQRETQRPDRVGSQGNRGVPQR